jgi:hypothetical protein
MENDNDEVVGVPGIGDNGWRENACPAESPEELPWNSADGAVAWCNCKDGGTLLFRDDRRRRCCESVDWILAVVEIERSSANLFY